MQKIIKLVTNEYLPKELPHGGILMNDGEDIDFTNFAVEPEPCPECPECTNDYVYAINDEDEKINLNDTNFFGRNGGVLNVFLKAPYIYDNNGTEYLNTTVITNIHYSDYHDDYVINVDHDAPDSMIFPIIAIDRALANTGGLIYFDTLEEALAEFNANDYYPWAHSYVPS